MHLRRLRRRQDFTYQGKHRYSLVFTVYQRRAVFTESEPVALCLSHILRAAADRAFAVLAYCCMPDHVHLVVQGTSEEANLPRFVQRAKQLSGYHFRHRRKLWQDGYYEYVIRPHEEIDRVVTYVLQNPVAAGIVRNAQDYPFSADLRRPDLQVGRAQGTPDCADLQVGRAQGTPDCDDLQVGRAQETPEA